MIVLSDLLVRYFIAYIKSVRLFEKVYAYTRVVEMLVDIIICLRKTN